MTDDIVAELAWLATTAIWSGKDTHLRETLRRARDEIVALRNTRAEAWGQGFEAAKAVVIALDGAPPIPASHAKAIRALKDKPS